MEIQTSLLSNVNSVSPTYITLSSEGEMQPSIYSSPPSLHVLTCHYVQQVLSTMARTSVEVADIIRGYILSNDQNMTDTNQLE